MDISRRDRRMVVIPRRSRCLKELSSIMGCCCSSAPPTCPFVFTLLSNLALSWLERDILPILRARVMPPPSLLPPWRFVCLPPAPDCCCCDAAANFARLPLERCAPLAMRFMLPSDADFLIDESTDDVACCCPARLSAESRDVRSPQLMYFICSSQCRCIILPSSTERLADNSSSIAARMSKPERFRIWAAKDAITLPNIPPRVPPNPTNPSRFNRNEDLDGVFDAPLFDA
mmetsp:Transcript_4745/g.9190  ORF Transcript_4745/g.9190 Transcript_4745/m.9190 type:complete len:231 (-) Transcript_4745:630-1322(-)